MTAEATEELAAELIGPRRPLGIVEGAHVLGGLRFLELRLFELLGRAAPLAETAEIAVWASEASLGAARRASDLAVLLPVSRGLPGVDEATAAAGEASRAVVAALETAPPGRELVARTVGVAYPALALAYGSRADMLAPAADGPLAAVLSRLVSDMAAQMSASEKLLAALGGQA